MNELRWILLVVGVLFIAGIYFREVIKQKRYIRSRIENYSAISQEDSPNLTIKPKEHDGDDVSDAIADLSVFLNDSRNDVRQNSTPLSVDDISDSYEETEQPDGAETNQQLPEQKIIVLYITARADGVFNGPDIAEVVEASGMKFGEMNIYHYSTYGNPKQNLFSLANLHEPGTFNPDTLAEFTTDGLALFLCLPVDMPGEQAFELMLACARNIADDLGADLRNDKNKIASQADFDELHALAALYP